MNDCIYNWILVCERYDCTDCPHYCNVNSKKGMEIYSTYQSDVDKALKPVYEEWKAIFKDLGGLD